MDRTMAYLHLAMVGRFLNFYHSIHMVRKWAMGQWKLKGSVSISAISSRMFLFSLTFAKDLSMVLVGSWLYGKHPFTLAKWKPSFNPTNDLVCMALVWIILYRLPLEFWDEKIYQWIRDLFGNFTIVDGVTLSKSRFVFVHFCVNVAVNKTLATFIILKSRFWKNIEVMIYENSSIFYQNCKTRGHTTDTCQLKIQKEKEKVSSWRVVYNAKGGSPKLVKPSTKLVLEKSWRKKK